MDTEPFASTDATFIPLFARSRCLPLVEERKGVELSREDEYMYHFRHVQSRRTWSSSETHTGFENIGECIQTINHVDERPQIFLSHTERKESTS